MVRPLLAVAVLIVAVLTMASGDINTPSSTALIAPVDDSIVYGAWPVLIWHPDSTSGTGDSLLYEFHLALDETFASCVASGRIADTITGLLEYLPPGRRYTWRVLTLDTMGQVTESELETFRTYLPGDMNATRTVTSTDIITLVNYVFKGGTLGVPECAGNVNFNTVGGAWDVNSTAVLTLVNYVFKSGYAPRARCFGEFWSFDKWMPVHGDLLVRVSEPHRTNEQGDTVSLKLIFETTTHYINQPNALLFDFDSTGQSFYYRLHGVQEAPDPVFTFAGPGYFIGEYTLDTGVYEVSFERCQWVDRLQLTLTESYLRLSHLDSQFTEILFPLRWRRPYKSMCVSCYMPAGVEWVCGAFLDSLHAHVELTDLQFPDSGRVPYGLYEDPSFFLYADESVYDSALVVFDAFVQNVLAGMSEYSYMRIHLDNWDGRYERLPFLE